MKTKSGNRPTWAEINLDNLAFNFHSVKRFVNKQIRYMAVVKADAYGHGSIESSRRLEAEGIDWFGVALPEEGVEIRKAGVRKRILCLGGFWSGQEQQILNYNLTPVIFRLEQIEKLNQASKNYDRLVKIHVKIDTGMNRIGVRFDEVKEFADCLKNFGNLHVEGIMTHLASADDLRETEFTNLQMDRFNEAIRIFEEKEFNPVYKNLANSPGAIAHPRSHGNMVRLGGVLYGLEDDVLPKDVHKPKLKPVLSLHTQITSLKSVPKGETLGYSRTYKTNKKSLIATIPIGYQDGYSRKLSNTGRVIVNGVYADVLGMISMDWTLLDVTDVPNVRVGDEVTLIGEDSDLKITAEELARKIDTISYEVTCGLSERVKRNFLRVSKVENEKSHNYAV